MIQFSSVYNFQLSPVVKALILINFVVWFILVVLLQGLFLKSPIIYALLGLMPHQVFDNLWWWQIVTYMFVHAESVFHILFNMFALWMFGCELERLWGPKFFLAYYLVCGVGSGLIYLLVLKVMSLVGYIDPAHLQIPMVGASSAIFGILFAYGLVFSERVVLFMMIFPIKAVHFTILIGMIELVNLVNSGLGSKVSHLSHLCGFLIGFLFLQSWKRIQDFKIRQWRKGPVRLQILRNQDKKRH